VNNGPSATLEPLRLAVQRPVPERFWIRHLPRAWPLPPGPVCDLARGTLWETSTAVDLLAESRLDDVLYLPPVPPEHRQARDRLAAAHLARGTPVLVQLFLGDPPAPPGATVVYDLLPSLLKAGGPHDLGDRLPETLPETLPGAAAVWPLISGLTDAPELWEEGCRYLAAAGITVVQAMTPSLTPAWCRQLAEDRGEETFHALFHRPPRPERDFARAACRAGLSPFLPRPLPRPPLTGAENRRLAGELALAAELWLTLEESVGRGLALSRAAHWVDETSYDVGALVREGNLAVIPEIDAELRPRIAEGLRRGRLSLLDDLLAAYLAEEPVVVEVPAVGEPALEESAVEVPTGPAGEECTAEGETSDA